MSASAQHVIARFEAHRGYHALERLTFTGLEVCALVDEVYRLRQQLASVWHEALNSPPPASLPTTHPVAAVDLTDVPRETMRT